MGVHPGDRDHVTVRAPTSYRIEVAIFVLVLTLLAILAGPVAAQSRSAVQVAARVVSTGPSRDALILSQGMPGVFRTSLARVRVMRTAAPTGVLEPRRRQVQIDFLRN
jgi:hypothetical protein